MGVGRMEPREVKNRDVDKDDFKPVKAKMAPVTGPPPDRTASGGGGFPHRLFGIAARIAFAAAMIAALAGATTVIQWRADALVSQVNEPPMPARVIAAERLSGHDVIERYAGRIEAARETEMAFERGGLLVAVEVDEGDRVGEGGLIARLDTASLEAERNRLIAQKRQVEANLELAELTLARQETLQNQGHVSAQRLDEARLNVSALVAERDTTIAAIRAVEIDIEKSEIRAPFSGTIAARHVDEGAVLNTGTAVVELLESDRAQARIGVSPEIAEAIRNGAAVTLRYRDEVLDATAAASRPDIATATRTVTVLFDIKTDTPLPFGEIVELEITRHIDERGFWIPLTALSEAERGLWSVIIAKENPENGLAVTERAAVEVLHVEGEQAFVRGTLQDGAMIVIGGVERLALGQDVRPVFAEAAQ